MARYGGCASVRVKKRRGDAKKRGKGEGGWAREWGVRGYIWVAELEVGEVLRSRESGVGERRG